jgi:hypothetical protein
MVINLVNDCEIPIKKQYIDIETITYPTDYFIESDPFIEEIKRTGIKII